MLRLARSEIFSFKTSARLAGCYPSLHKENHNFDRFRTQGSVRHASTFFETVSQLPPVLFAQDALIQFHDVTHLPWWSSIVLSTIIIRAATTLPLSIYQQNVLAKVENISLEMPAIAEELKRETSVAVRKFQWTEKKAKMMYSRSLKKQWNNLIIRDNCHPAKAIVLVLIQVPVWICQSYAIRNLVYGMPDPSSIEAQTTMTELALGGFLFIPNLTDIDHSFIIPVAFGLLNLTIIEIQKLSRRVDKTSKLSSYATNLFRALTVLMAFISATVPSALCLYWFTSSLFGLSQNLLLLSPRFRRLVRIPKTKSELEEPYKVIMTRLREKLKLSKKIE